MAAAEFADWTWGQTDLAFLDCDDEVEVVDAEWSDENVRELTRQWKLAGDFSASHANLGCSSANGGPVSDGWWTVLQPESGNLVTPGKPHQSALLRVGNESGNRRGTPWPTRNAAVKTYRQQLGSSFALFP